MGTTLLVAVVAVTVGLAVLLRSSKSQIPIEQIQALLHEQGGLLVDVRSAGEFLSGHLDGALNIAHDQIAQAGNKLPKNKAVPVVVYCLSGHRAANAQHTLKSMGYTTVVNAGTYGALKGTLSAQ